MVTSLSLMAWNGIILCLSVYIAFKHQVNLNPIRFSLIIKEIITYF